RRPAACSRPPGRPGHDAGGAHVSSAPDARALAHRQAGRPPARDDGRSRRGGRARGGRRHHAVSKSVILIRADVYVACPRLSRMMLVTVLAYLIGSVPFALLLTRRWGAGDLRRIGSGKLG